jgi:hypothetical protein
MLAQPVAPEVKSMLNRIALSLAAAALLAASPSLAQTAPATARPETVPPVAALPEAVPPAPSVQKAQKVEKHKGHGTPQTHHCVKDGKLLAGVPHKKCTAAGGAWQKAEAKPEAPRAEPKVETPPAPAPVK